LIKRSETGERGVNINIVYIFDALRDFDAGRQWLSKARQTNDVGLIFWDVDPLFKNLRDHLNEETKAFSPEDFAAAEKHIVDLLEAKMPGLFYHNTNHVYDVLHAVMAIAKHEQVNDDDVRLLRLAALLHDVGFTRSSHNHEELGAEMAREMLPSFGLTNDQIEAIVNMILATRLPQSPATHLEKILCDADLDYLGRADFYTIGGNLFKELHEQGVVESEREWNLVQRTFLQSHRYHTNYGKTNRESSKQERLQEIVAKLKNRS
jgi:putative nucleotidyltransferase with HDIG domain